MKFDNQYYIQGVSINIIIFRYVSTSGGADPAAADIYGSTALHYAAERGRESIACILLKHKACANTVNRDGWSPLHLAAVCGNVAVAKALVKNLAGKI